MKELYNEAIQILQNAQLVKHAGTLRRTLAGIDSATYKVAVVGQFKAGKSTLINRVLLKEPLLFENVVEATAVPTQVQYGPSKELSVCRYQTAKLTVAVDAGKTEQVEVVESIGPSTTLANPTSEDIKAYTTASTEVARANLARTVAKATLTWPAEALQGLTVIDTPGINSTNEAVAYSTYKVIPESDVVLFVNNARQLQDVDLTFLQGKVFDQSVSRAMVVLNYNEGQAVLNEQQLSDIVEAVAAQLANIGRSHVPVTWVNLGKRSQENQRVSGTPLKFKDRILEAGSDTEPVQPGSPEAFERQFVEFVRQNVAQGRAERIQGILKRELEGARVACAIQVAALQKTPEEKAGIQEEIDRAKCKYQADYRRLSDEFMDDLTDLQRLHLRTVDSGIDAVQSHFLDTVKQCKSLADIKTLADTSSGVLTAKLGDVLFQASAQTKASLKDLEKKYQTRIYEAARPWLQTVQTQLQIDVGLLAKIPEPVIYLADFLLTDALIPGGWFIALFSRLAATYLPIIRDMTPVRLVAKIIADMISKTVVEQVGAARKDLHQKMQAAFEQAKAKVEDAWKIQGDEYLNRVLEPLMQAQNSAKDPALEAKLNQAVQQLNGLLARVPAT